MKPASSDTRGTEETAVITTAASGEEEISLQLEDLLFSDSSLLQDQNSSHRSDEDEDEDEDDEKEFGMSRSDSEYASFLGFSNSTMNSDSTQNFPDTAGTTATGPSLVLPLPPELINGNHYPMVTTSTITPSRRSQIQPPNVTYNTPSKSSSIQPPNVTYNTPSESSSIQPPNVTYNTPSKSSSIQPPNVTYNTPSKSSSIQPPSYHRTPLHSNTRTPVINRTTNIKSYDIVSPDDSMEVDIIEAPPPSISDEILKSTTTSIPAIEPRDSPTTKSKIQPPVVYVNSTPSKKEESVSESKLSSQQTSPSSRNTTNDNTVTDTSDYNEGGIGMKRRKSYVSLAESAVSSVSSGTNGTTSMSRNNYAYAAKTNGNDQTTTRISSRNAVKILLKLLSDPNNRSCADCRAALVDSSKIYASFYHPRRPVNSISLHNSISTIQEHSHQKDMAVAPNEPYSSWSFTKLHALYAPISASDSSCGISFSNSKHFALSRQVHNDDFIYQMAGGGFGVFLCKSCSLAHLSMSHDIPSIVVKPISTNKLKHNWSAAELHIMINSGGNALARTVYEHSFQRNNKQITIQSTLEERQVFSRSKYQALSFLFHQKPKVNDSSFSNMHGNVPSKYKKNPITYGQENDSHNDSSNNNQSSVLPSRLVDFFAVVSADPDNFALEKSIGNDLQNSTKLEDVRLEPMVADCFPRTRDDMVLPQHVSKFVFPDGLIPRERQSSPTFFTFTLTSENGTRLYGGALQIFDQVVELGQIFQDQNSTLPSWIEERDDTIRSSITSSCQSIDNHMTSVNTDDTFDSFNKNNSMKTAKKKKRLSDVVFLPRCLVILSHYGFFDVWRTFLQQIYRISLMEAPLPIERYISNFVCEVPLPPQGRIEVKFGFMEEFSVSISRPAINRLPLTRFSYKPLFATLSVSNIMVLMGCLMEESRIVLCSKHYPLLGPIGEAILSLLFPFVWQGMYIPITPYHMLDILDAPVPYLIGIHSRYLQNTPPKRRPSGVVFVDLDDDVIHLGYEANTTYLDPTHGENYSSQMNIPILPEKDAIKLKSKLDKHGGKFYITPPSKWKGRIVRDSAYHNTSTLIQNTNRETYAYQTSIYNELHPQHEQHPELGTKNIPSDRALRLATVDKAFADNELLQPISGFATDVGTLIERDIAKEDKWKIRGMKKEKPRRKRFYSDAESSFGEPSQNLSHSTHLLDLDALEDFPTDDIRNAFLRFFVAIFQKYDKYLNVQGNVRFDQEKFLIDWKEGEGSKNFMAKFTGSQMFERFIEERISFPKQPEVLFFDESIVAKNNRSMKKKLKKKKEVTPFLVDDSGAITETFTPPPPSNWGLPDDGRSYHYAHFPKLDPKLFGKIREPKQWDDSKQRSRKTASSALTEQHRIISHLIMSFSPAKNDFRKYLAEDNLEWAIHALAYKNAQISTTSKSHDKKSKGSGTDFASNEKNSGKNNGFVSHDMSIPMGLIPKAQKIIVAARRKQGISLALVVRLQSFFRMILVKNAYSRFLCAMISLQRKHREDTTFELRTHGNRTKIRNSIVIIQRFSKRCQARNTLKRKIRSVIYLQCWIRGIYARRFRARFKKSIIKIQTLHRGRKARFVYWLTLSTIVKLQGVIRGCMTRLHIMDFMKRRLNQYRVQMFELWKHARTPLVYRSKFWLLVVNNTILDFALVESELIRLWNLLGIKFQDPIGNINEATDALSPGFGRVLSGLSALTYYRFIQVNTLLESKNATMKSFKGIIFVFPAELANLQDSSDLQARGIALNSAADRIELERLHIYEKLTSLSTVKMGQQQLQVIMKMFKIDESEKLKKQRIANGVWESYDNAQSSARALLIIFPELVESTNISSMKPSKKGRKLFRINKKDRMLMPLTDKAMAVECKIDQLLIRDLREVGVGFLSSVPKNSAASLVKPEVFVSQNFERQYNAIIYVDQKSREKNISTERLQMLMRYSVIRSYLYKFSNDN